MFIEEIGRHLAVSSFSELEKSLKRDDRFWNVISIRGPRVPKPDFLRYAKSHVEIICEDTETDDPAVSFRPPRKEDVAAIFSFLDKHPGEPVLVHCVAGISRSTAVALAIIVHALTQHGAELPNHGPLIERAAKLLLRVRPQARPNALFLRLFLEWFLPTEAAAELSSSLMQHPALQENRTTRPKRPGSPDA